MYFSPISSPMAFYRSTYHSFERRDGKREVGTSRANVAEQVFLNVVLDDAVEELDGGEKKRIGMVVIRGNSVVMLEALERIGDR